MTNKRKIVFCFPYRGVGGVPLLFVRIGGYLAAQNQEEIYLVDYCDGFMAKSRAESLTKFIEYQDDSEIWLPEDAVVIFQSLTPWSIYPSLRFPSGTKVLFWNCHPFNLIPTLPGLRKWMQEYPSFGRFMLGTVLRHYRNKMRRLIDFMLNKKALVFMDEGNVNTTSRYLDVAIKSPAYLPIPVDIYTSEFRQEQRHRKDRADTLRVVWIGRLVDFKYYILKYALQELNRVQVTLDIPIEIVVVGGGDFGVRLQAEVAELKNIHTRFVEYISPSELDDFLLQHADLLLAMGTAALDGAKLGVPVILLDVSYGEVPSGYVFRWLHDQQGYSLGKQVSSADIIPDNKSMLDRINELLDDYSRISDMTLEYVQTHHSLPVVAGLLSRIVNEVTFTYEQLVADGFASRGIIYSGFARLRRGLEGI